MLHPYDLYASLDAYRHYYTEQAGNGTKVFRGRQTQNGYGIGNCIGSLAKGTAPFLEMVGKQLLKTAIGVASDVMASDVMVVKII